MKKITVLLLLGALVGYLVTPTADAQRGDLYGARALQSLEQAFKTTGVLTFPNYAAAPVTCNAANLGVYYYDTALTEARVCGGAGPAWVGIGAGLTVGTAQTIPRWNAVPDDLEDTYLTENDVPAGGAGGDVLTQTLALNIMDGADVTRAIFVDITSANHVGGPNTNTLYAMEIDNIVNDDDTIEYALAIDAGWDVDIYGLTDTLHLGSAVQMTAVVDNTGGEIFTVDSSHAAGGSNDWVEVVANVAIMDGIGVGGDLARGIFLDMSNANHTDAGTGNVVIGLDIDDIVGDPQAVEYAINIQDGWDQAIHLDDGSEADDNITFGADDDVHIYFDNAADNLEIEAQDEGAGVQVQIGELARFLIDGGPGWSDLVYDANNVVNVGYDLLTLNVTAVRASDGDDVINVLEVDWNETEWTAAGTSELRGLNVEAITQDADATSTAINIGDGWDQEIYFQGANAYIDGVTNVYYSAGTHVALNIGTASVLRVYNGSGVQSNKVDINTTLHADTDYLELVPNNVTAMAATDISNALSIMNLDANNPNHTGGNLNAIYIDALTQDAQADEYAINVQAGWDAAFFHIGIAHANLVAAGNGSIVFCTDCDPATTPCTSVGAQTGAFAFRVNGAWDCPW